MPNKPHNAFIHRLIPVAAVAGLTFSACVIPESEPTVVSNNQIDGNADANNATSSNMTSGNNAANTTSANSTTANNTSANSTSPANNTGVNSTTPANNTSANSTSPANSTTPVNNTSPANNTTPTNNTTPANNTSPVNNTTPANNTSPGTEDGVLSDEEISAFCQGFYDCDPTLFAESYDSVDACKQETRAYVDAVFSGLEQNYGAGCAAAYEAFYEGYLNASMCVSDSFTIDEARLTELEAAFDAAYDMYCL